MAGGILALNAGSSSIKLALFRLNEDGAITPLFRGLLEDIGGAPHFIVHSGDGATLQERRWSQGAGETHESLLGAVIQFVETHLGATPLIGVGHRVVHGGEHFFAPVRVNPEVLAAIVALMPLAPLHQPHNVAPMRALASLRPDLPQVACFDTGFHRTMPLLARRFALPHALTEAGIRRYGFHGLSYEFIARRLRALEPSLAAGRVIAAHLGSGASLCAMADGKSLDTTMGFTALEGLMMGTRCGALDPGVILHLLQQRGMSAKEIEDLLYHRSGLLGVSGIGSDMRDLIASAAPAAQEAVALFVFRIVREIGALASSLGGLDALVFTAGIGEHVSVVRARVGEGLRWLGVEIDAAANARNAQRISAPASAVVVLVVPTDEEAMIAQHTRDVIGLA